VAAKGLLAKAVDESIKMIYVCKPANICCYGPLVHPDKGYGPIKKKRCNTISN